MATVAKSPANIVNFLKSTKYLFNGLNSSLFHSRLDLHDLFDCGFLIERRPGAALLSGNQEHNERRNDGSDEPADDFLPYGNLY